jgi:hypothetical protein
MRFPKMFFHHFVFRQFGPTLKREGKREKEKRKKTCKS